MSLKHQNNNIGHNIMNKNVRKNVNYLKKLAANTKDKETRNKMDEVIDLHKDISNSLEQLKIR